MRLAEAVAQKTLVRDHARTVSELSPEESYETA